MSLNRVMNLGLQAMNNAKTGVSTVSHNIANAETEGYSRQRVETQSNHPVVRQGFTIGTGAKIKGIKRLADEFIDKQIQEDTSLRGDEKSKTYALNQIEQIFNEGSDKGIAFQFKEFYGSLHRLSENPENGAIREMVKNNGKDLTKTFNVVHNQLLGVKENIDARITGLVIEANVIIKNVAELNGNIKQMQIIGKNANDFIDERGTKLKRLAEIVDISVIVDDDANCIVNMSGSGSIVDNTDAFELYAPRRGVSREPVTVHITSPTGGQHDVTDQMEAGELHGYVTMRDGYVNELLDKLDNIAGTLIIEFNDIHKQGYGLNDETGMEFFKALTVLHDEETEQDFYDFTGAAQNIGLDGRIVDKIANIAAGQKPGAVADNRNVVEMIKVSHNKLFDDGFTNMEDYYSGIVGGVGLELQSAKKSLEHREGVLNQLNKIRESTSGVSLDEETTQLVRYQHEFDAAAKVISVTDELFDTVLSLKR